MQNYNVGTITLAKSGILPPTYVSLTYWPFEAAAQNPTVRQAIALIKTTSHLTPDFAHLQALDAWLLWAVSAKACGSNLTGACVIQHAGSHEGLDRRRDHRAGRHPRRSGRALATASRC